MNKAVMTPLLAVSITCAACGGGGGGASGPSSTSSPSAPGSAAHSSAPTGAPGAGGAQYKITVNGQAVTTAGNGVMCGPNMYRGSQFDVNIGAPKYNGTYNTYSDSFSITNGPPPKLMMVFINSDDGIYYSWGAGDGQESPPTRGDAQLNTSDKTYKITGHIAPSYNNRTQQRYDDTAPLVPFEIDATCP